MFIAALFILLKTGNNPNIPQLINESTNCDAFTQWNTSQQLKKKEKQATETHHMDESQMHHHRHIMKEARLKRLQTTISIYLTSWKRQNDRDTKYINNCQLLR